MTTTLKMIGAIAVAAVLMSGAALAAPNYEPSYDPKAPEPFAGAAVQTATPQTPDWHHVRGHHYNRWDEYVPGWIAVPNTVR